MASISEGDDNLSSFTDRKDFGSYISVFPFSELKNKWLQGFMFELGSWFCNVDQRQQAINGCNRFRIRDNGDAARQTLFDTGANSIGEGLFTAISPGLHGLSVPIVCGQWVPLRKLPMETLPLPPLCQSGVKSERMIFSSATIYSSGAQRAFSPVHRILRARFS